MIHPTKCPFCGSVAVLSKGMFQEWECGTFAYDPDEDGTSQSKQCNRICKEKTLGVKIVSDTPRTDAACGNGNYIHCVDDDFARQLERELRHEQQRSLQLQLEIDYANFRISRLAEISSKMLDRIMITCDKPTFNYYLDELNTASVEEPS